MARRILIAHIGEQSGHYHAGLAISRALKRQDPQCSVLTINTARYTNPVLEKIITSAYMGVITVAPDLWNYIYDNPVVYHKTRTLKSRIHENNAHKLYRLVTDFQPDVMICTQAFPCGILAGLKRDFNLNIPLIAVLTDFASHAYWVYDEIDHYVVPHEKMIEPLTKHGAKRECVEPLGIPIILSPQARDEELYSLYGFSRDVPLILVMGGSRGFGPLPRIVAQLDALDVPLQVAVVAGSNKRVKDYITAHLPFYRKHVVVFGFTDCIASLMRRASLLITKAGGITCAEALACNLPMIIMRPIPGQEQANTRFLTEQGAAIHVKTHEEMGHVVTYSLMHSERLAVMRSIAAYYARPNAADLIAQLTRGSYVGLSSV